MMFGGMFKKWFGGGQRKRAERIQLLNERAATQAALAQFNPNQGTTSGYLAYDRNQDSEIDPATETLFKNDLPGASTDVEGLASFDDNSDGLIDASDAVWKDFGVWQDANKNGKFDTGEFKGFTDLGIANIDLSKGQSNGLLTVTYEDGHQGTLALSLFAAKS